MTFWRDWGKAQGWEEAPSVGEDLRVYAIGDIHGRADLLDELLIRIGEDDESRGSGRVRLIFLGDLVDRGPASRNVVDRVISLRHLPNVTCLKGNHEEVFVMVARGDAGALPFFLRMGGDATLASYGLPLEAQGKLDDDAILEWIDRTVPDAHIDFLDDLPGTEQVGDYLFVHAGVRPRVSPEDQSMKDLLWIRQDFLKHRHRFSHMIVHGHSISEEVDIQPNRIGIDTGAFQTGRLTAIGLQGTDRWFLQTGE